MCDRNFMLIIFIILKIIILIITPIFLYFLYKKENKLFSLIAGLDIVFIIIFIILRLVGNPCLKNSTFSFLKEKKMDSAISENTDSLYESILYTKKFTNLNNKDSYYYSLLYEPLSNAKLSCNKKSYLKNYGDSITAITTLISNYYGIGIDEADLISYLEDNNLVDCYNGFDFDKVFNALGEYYNYDVVQISKSKVDSYLSNGNSVLVETRNKYKEKNNFGCEKDYIVIYNKTNNGNYSIVNPNDKYYSYFCPSNTIGYGSIIEANQNDREFTIDEIDSKTLRYFVIEVK